jgi:uncharacterized protein (TIGR02996 family)
MEEAGFIRVILDSSHDDSPRLVYADWREERADPRSDFLSAELEWVKPWRKGRRPPCSPTLLEQAGGLDPEWVARVSRPPLGVCCTHVKFTDARTPPGPADLKEFERDAGFRIPVQFPPNWSGSARAGWCCIQHGHLGRMRPTTPHVQFETTDQPE